MLFRHRSSGFLSLTHPASVPFFVVFSSSDLLEVTYFSLVFGFLNLRPFFFLFLCSLAVRPEKIVKEVWS